MLKRKIVIGGYDTAAHGWTLCAWSLSPATLKTNYVDKTGGDGSWDMSTALSDGIPRYKDRTFTATLECSAGDRLDREAKIRHMVNLLDGLRERIVPPDHPEHYLMGRIQVEKVYSDLAHAQVKVTATCEPWKYKNTVTEILLLPSTSFRTATLANNGRRWVVPELIVSGNAASVDLSYGTATVNLSAGTHLWPDMLLPPGISELAYSGSGTLAITFREAVLE